MNSHVTADLTVALGTRSYPIHIGTGLLARLPELLGDQYKNRPFFLLSDAQVGGLYGAQIDAAMQGFAPVRERYFVPAGEASKSITHYTAVIDHFLAAGLTRDSVIIALGGGVVGDLGGFVAGTILRGIPFVQIPTTLLAQVDSSVGGKTGINSTQGKNLIGVFHQPSLVLCDLDVLQSLSARDFASGLAEVVKYGLIADHAFFTWLEENKDAINARDEVALRHMIRTSCAIKAAIVAEDELETGTARMTLNLGHTFGHALEAIAGYDGSLTHGEGVALGMVMACRLSEKLMGLSPDVTQRAIALLHDLHLPTKPSERFSRPVTADDMLPLMAKDKKALADGIRFILLRQIGTSQIRKLAGADLDLAAQAIADSCV